jgi:P27 family predicted phage terminase small subunit
VLKNDGKKHLTKKEIRQRAAAEERIKPASNDVHCPAWLDAYGRSEFRRVAADLRQRGLLANVYMVPLAIYADAVSRYRHETEAGKDWAGENEDERPAPNAKILDTFAKIIRQYATDFGFNPAALAKIAVAQSNEEPKDPFEERFG